MTEPAPEGSKRLSALSELWRDAVKPPTAGELEQGLKTLRARVATSRAPSHHLRWALIAAALVAVAAMAVPLVRVWQRPNQLEPVMVARVDGGKILEGGYLAELGGSGVRLLFNEGSEFSLMAGTRGRLRDVSAEGARLVLDNGTASFRITPNPKRRWWVEAGPFLVAVKGTNFTVTWDSTHEKLAVDLNQGRVAVSGPIVGDELFLRPGHSLTVNLPKRESVISEVGAEHSGQPTASAPASASADANLLPPVTGAPNAAPSAAINPSAAPPPASASAAPSARRWREAIAKGQWENILADVERDGIESSLRTLSSNELFTLADAARYRRRPELARAALLAQRERFPGSSRAADAVFLLGRVEELRGGGKRAAIQRYDEYLVLAPSGTYAAEALGRKMILVKDTAGPAAARRVAEEYLARFPSGSYVEAARAIQRAR